MGLFDESDSDDVAGGGSHDEGGGMLEGEAEEEEEEEEEEEDPLDAYMRSLDAREGGASSSSSGATIARDGVGGGSGTAPKDDWGASPSTHPSSYVRGGGGGGGSGGGIDHGGRLDVDAEDEATSHWVETAADAAEKPKGGFANGMLDKFDGGGEGGGGGTAAAADATSGGALYGSFVRAGGGGGKGGGGTKGPAPPAAADVDRNDDESSRRDPHREVDPLERVDHRGVRYAPFRRTFHVPSDTIGGKSWRDEHDVACNPPIYDPMLGFGDLVPPPRDDDDDDDGTAAGSSDDPVFPEELTRAIIKCGYDSPTIVQSQTLSVALSGCDALITASTGSGKTLAYIWPMIVHINDQAHIEPGIDGPIGIVLTPTRELARQVYRYAKIFVECIGGRAVEVSGGNRGTWELTKELRLGCEIVVGSPGRLIDVVRKKGTNLRRVTFLVLDEADRMLDMGFEKQVNSIMENVRPDRQTLLLSATFGKRVEKVARSWLRNPVRIAIGQTGASSEHVDSHVMVLPSHPAKVQWLVEMLPILSPLGRCLVFVSTRAECDNLCRIVEVSCGRGGDADGGGVAATIVSIHGEKDQRDRNSAISTFKKNARAILIATDVAARGLDIPDVMVVVNFDAAKNLDAHVHRVGRAGRLQKGSKTGDDGTAAGEGQQKQQQHQRGVAYTLLTERDANFAASLAEAFDREGREVSSELALLCRKSSRYGGGRVKHSKVGLGFGAMGNAASGSSAGAAAQASHYGPSPSSNQPARKRSRWKS